MSAGTQESHLAQFRKPPQSSAEATQIRRTRRRALRRENPCPKAEPGNSDTAVLCRECSDRDRNPAPRLEPPVQVELGRSRARDLRTTAVRPRTEGDRQNAAGVGGRAHRGNQRGNETVKERTAAVAAIVALRLGRPIALALVENGRSRIGDTLHACTREGRVEPVAVSLPPLVALRSKLASPSWALRPNSEGRR